MPDLRLALEHLGTMYQVVEMIAVEKSIASTVRKFHAAFRNLAVLGFVSSGSILSESRGLVRDYVRQSYLEGLKEGGIADDEISTDDENAIDDLIAAQESHITDFVKAIRDAKNDKAAQRDILARVELWTASIEAAGRQGLASAKSNIMGTWQYGDTEHCETCQGLNGKRHRVKWFVDKGYIPRQPGSETLDCGGWKCQCQVKDDNGKRIL